MKLDGLGRCEEGLGDNGRSGELERETERWTGNPGVLERTWKEDWAADHKPDPWKCFQKGRARGSGTVACFE